MPHYPILQMTNLDNAPPTQKPIETPLIWSSVPASQPMDWALHLAKYRQLNSELLTGAYVSGYCMDDAVDGQYPPRTVPKPSSWFDWFTGGAKGSPTTIGGKPAWWPDYSHTKTARLLGKQRAARMKQLPGGVDFLFQDNMNLGDLAAQMIYLEELHRTSGLPIIANIAGLLTPAEVDVVLEFIDNHGGEDAGYACEQPFRPAFQGDKYDQGVRNKPAKVWAELTAWARVLATGCSVIWQVGWYEEMKRLHPERDAYWLAYDQEMAFMAGAGLLAMSMTKAGEWNAPLIAQPSFRGDGKLWFDWGRKLGNPKGGAADLGSPGVLGRQFDHGRVLVDFNQSRAWLA